MLRSNHLKRSAAVASSALALVFTAGAVAHTLPPAKAAPIAKRAAAAAAQETHASSYRIGKCSRPTAHRYVCHVTFHYASGRRCTADAVAMYASPTSTRIKSGTTNFICY